MSGVQLPPELILYIIQLASIQSTSTQSNSITKKIDRKKNNNNLNYNSNLLSLPISKQFNSFSSPLLFQSIILSEKNLDLFLIGLKSRIQNHEGNSKLKEVKKIKFQFISDSISNTSAIKEILSLCRESIKSITCNLVTSIYLDDLSLLPHLTSLHLLNSTLLPSLSPTTFLLPSLTQLTLNYVQIPLHQFTPLSAPNLTSLAIDEMPLGTGAGGRDCSKRFLNRFSEQLVGLGLGDPTPYLSSRRGGGAEEVEWNEMRRLKVLSFGGSADWFLETEETEISMRHSNRLSDLPGVIGQSGVEGRGRREEGKAIKDFLNQFENSSLISLHYPYLRNIGFEPLRSFTLPSTTTNTIITAIAQEEEEETNKCLKNLTTLIYSLPEILYSFSTVLRVEPYTESERLEIKSNAIKQFHLVAEGNNDSDRKEQKQRKVEWEGESKEIMDKRFFTTFWRMVDEFNWNELVEERSRVKNRWD